MKSILLISLLALSSLAQAKVVTNTQNSFRINIPDAWVSSASQASKGRSFSSWKNSGNTAALVLDQVDLKGKTLESWSKRVSLQNPEAVLSQTKLDSRTARRLKFKNQDGYTHILWLTQKGTTGALITLVYTEESGENIPQIEERIVSSFHWNK